MWSSCKRSSGTLLGQWQSGTYLNSTLSYFIQNWSNLRRKYFSKIPTDINALSCGRKAEKISGILDAISPACHPQKSSQHVRAWIEGDGAICSKNRKIVPYHGANPNTRNGGRLRSPSPIMAPDSKIFTQF